MEIPERSALIDVLFGSASNRAAQLANLALRELDKGLGQFTSKNYELAITSFERAIRLAPTEESAINAYDYMARAQQSQGNTDAAIESYKKALKIDPKRDDLYTQLGNIYTTEQRFTEAAAQYELAVKNNPSAANRYSLGQGYMAVGRLDEAKAQFELVKTQSPTEPFGSFGLGQVLSKQGNYEEAISAFNAAIVIKRDYWEAFSEIGYARANQGNFEQAQEVADNLRGNDDLMSFALSNFIYEKSKPKMTAVYSSDLYTLFPSKLGPGSQLSGINVYLQTANVEKTLSMVFQFSKEMDPRSVENTFNWKIERAIGTGRGDGYNYDMKLKETEVAVPPRPVAVYYDQKEKTATVLFTLRQNSTATGTIDPSHINFIFSGTDSTGLSMDKSADMYSGFSGFA